MLTDSDNLDFGDICLMRIHTWILMGRSELLKS